MIKGFGMYDIGRSGRPGSRFTHKQDQRGSSPRTRSQHLALVLALICIVSVVYWSRGHGTFVLPAQAQLKDTVQATHAGLGPAVREMLDAFRVAISSGRIEDLAEALALNEIKPDVGADPGVDVVTHLKQRTGDSDGRAALSMLGLLLETTPQLLPLGRDLENNRVWLWPGFAETPLGRLSAAEMVDFERLVPHEKREAMLKSGRYTGPRLIIGQDGVWHQFLLD
jgi:hypothetical protein